MPKRQPKPQPKSRDLLRAYIADHGIKKLHFAKTVGVSPTILSRWLTGVHRPSGSARMMVEHVTDGAVPAAGWD